MSVVYLLYLTCYLLANIDLTRASYSWQSCPCENHCHGQNSFSNQPEIKLSLCPSFKVTLDLSPTSVTEKYCGQKQEQPKDNVCYTSKEYIRNEVLGSCYRVHDRNVTWAEAFMLCRKEGTELAVINSKEEADYLLHLKGDKPGDSWHIGFLLVQGSWITTDGQTLSEAGYSTWSEYQPSHYNYGGDTYERFGSLCNDGLNDLINEAERGFFCEQKL